MKIKEIYYYYPNKKISNNFLNKKYPKWKVTKLFNFYMEINTIIT